MTRPANHLDEPKSHHEYVETKDGFGVPSRGYKSVEEEYDPAAHQYPKHVVIHGHTHIARDAAHEDQLQRDHAPKVAAPEVPEVEVPKVGEPADEEKVSE